MFSQNSPLCVSEKTTPTSQVPSAQHSVVPPTIGSQRCPVVARSCRAVFNGKSPMCDIERHASSLNNLAALVSASLHMVAHLAIRSHPCAIVACLVVTIASGCPLFASCR